MLKDALLNPIILGEFYGYSRVHNGRVNVSVGKALRETPTGKVTLEKVVEYWGVYGNAVLERQKPSSRAVYSRTLFPVREEDYTELKLK